MSVFDSFEIAMTLAFGGFFVVVGLVGNFNCFEKFHTQSIKNGLLLLFLSLFRNDIATLT